LPELTLNHTHTIYDNFVLANEIEDQYNSKLDLVRFCTVDNSLVGVAGDTKKIHVYRATNGTEKLEMGAGNTKNIEVSYVPEEYKIQLAQNRFPYYDEEVMVDPMVVPVGLGHMATDMFNTIQADIFAEFNKATLTVHTGGTNKPITFDSFVDAVALLNLENIEDVEIFAFVNPAEMANLRKSLKEDLKYVEGFVRSGYVGTVAGVNIYTKKDADTGTIVLGTKEAVTLFNKKGVEVEQERDANVRLNEIYSRKYYLAALTDATKAVKIIRDVPSLISAEIDGTPTVGEDSSLNIELDGVPIGDVTYTYKWQKADSETGTYSDISSATNATYEPQSGDATKWIRCIVKATANAKGEITTAPKKVVSGS
jgi:hypothetical protein